MTVHLRLRDGLPFLRAGREPTPTPEGRELLRLEVRNAETPFARKASWIKTTARMGPEYAALQKRVKSERLQTVCQEAAYPNMFECWEGREATFLIGGDQCTRRCDFRQIDTGRPQPLGRDEPRRVAESVQNRGLKYATITGVASDDLPDGRAWLYAETVPRIFKRIRPAFRCDRSLDVTNQAHAFALVTKPNLVLGMGETREEVSQAVRDMHDTGLRVDNDHPVPAPLAATPPGRAVGQAGGVRRARGRGRGDRVRRSPVGTAVRFVYRARRLYDDALQARRPRCPTTADERHRKAQS